MIAKEYNIDIDLSLLANETVSIIEKVGLQQNQVALQYANKKNWHAGIGKSDLLDCSEQEYINFHEELDGTHLKEILVNLDFSVAHARIMVLPPKSCYTTHVDYYTRYHIPVVSKTLQTFMIFPYKEKVVRMHPGKMYWTNTHELHNFVNGTNENRIHIVFNNADEEKNLNNPYLRM
jgi:hypothetical protein